jgi:hypothetical protein
MASETHVKTLALTAGNLAVLAAGGHPVYLVKAPDAASWDYDRPIRVVELPELRFKRHLLMYETHGHREALELEVIAGTPPSRSELIGKTLVQDTHSG